MRLVITGTPGTGKTKIAPLFARAFEAELIALSGFVKRHGLSTKKTGEKIVDIKRLRRKLLHELQRKKNYIVEGHLACEFMIPADFIVVCRCNPVILMKRLLSRRYKKKKVEENLLAEVLDYCSQRVDSEYNKNYFEIDTSKTTPEQAAKKIILAIKNKKRKIDKVDYSKTFVLQFSTGKAFMWPFCLLPLLGQKPQGKSP